MTAQVTDALVDAIEASYGLPVPTPHEFAARIEEQLAIRGYCIVGPALCWCDGAGRHIRTDNCTPCNRCRQGPGCPRHTGQRTTGSLSAEGMPA